MGSGPSSYDDYDDDYSYDDRRYSRQAPSHHRPRNTARRPDHVIQEERIVERRHSPVEQHHPKTVVTERHVGRPIEHEVTRRIVERRPSPVVEHHTRTVVTEHRSPPPPSNPIVHREVRRVIEEKPEVITTRRSPVPTERVVQHHHHQDNGRHGRVLTPERVVREVVRERVEPERVIHYDDYDDEVIRTRPTTARYYDDRDPASWYRRERSAQREKVRRTIDKRKRHQEVVTSLYRDGTMDDSAYRSSWTRRY